MKRIDNRNSKWATASALRTTGRVLLLLPVLAAIPQAEAATVRGTFQYQHTGRSAPTPIRFAKVEVWHCDACWWGIWDHIGTAWTDANGSMSFTDTRGSGKYGLRVFATNYAAVVWPNETVATHPFYAEADQPAGPPRQLQASSTGSILDFSFIFNNAWIAQHYNLAEVTRLAHEYATARRDPSETDLLPPINVQPTPWSVSPTVTFYNAPFDTLVIKDTDTFQDYLILHEYAHFLEEQISSFAPLPTYHDGCLASTGAGGPILNSMEHAWMEAFASYFAQAVSRVLPPDTITGGRDFGTQSPETLETPPPCPVVGQAGAFGTVTPAMVENFVGAVLWDLFDPPGDRARGVEVHDSVAGLDREIFRIFDRELDVPGRFPTIFDFRNAWSSRGFDISALDCILSRYGMLAPRAGCRPNNATQLTGDFNGDGKTDIALTGPLGWPKLPVAFSTGSGFNITNFAISNFGTWAANERAYKLTGDFNGDGKTDLALTGPPDWTAIPVAMSNGNGTFTVTNFSAGVFARWAADPEARVLTGDFNGDRRTDIALLGPPGWKTLRIAYSNGDGSFWVTSYDIRDFCIWASDVRASILTGDFNGDGRTDIALTGPPGWRRLPVAFSRGYSGFQVTNEWVGDFGDWAATPGVSHLVGDFNHDGKADIALTGAQGWGTLPVAFSYGWGGFGVTNMPVPGFGSYAATPGAVKLVGDFNGDGMADIALTGPAGWTSIPIAYSNETGAFFVTNRPIPNFGAWAATPQATKLVGDFNGDGKQDIALTGAAGWLTLPLALSTAGLTPFTVVNPAVYDFAIWSAVQ